MAARRAEVRKSDDDGSSRYRRRSAHLPHIGDDACREALRSMRNVAIPPR